MSNQNTPGGMLKEGLADALGFVIGALAGWQLGVLLGFDFVGTPGYGVPQIIGLVLIVVGCGLGRLVARRLLSVDK
ncbi:hypothetical protein [Roseateles toxinivorans]|uniref:Uncharacterized protein n=1 Tax=Roseateles toxinivorans TaxID=270368 RepID=A0A4V3CT20_9BURK|nr:hypothetical protein [Roseateles toxinivorans]TDP63268.1 hypothetical protein DES47_105272 [Roseateles toxinivorans]